MSRHTSLSAFSDVTFVDGIMYYPAEEYLLPSPDSIVSPYFITGAPPVPIVGVPSDENYVVPSHVAPISVTPAQLIRDGKFYFNAEMEGVSHRPVTILPAAEPNRYWVTLDEKTWNEIIASVTKSMRQLSPPVSPAISRPPSPPQKAGKSSRRLGVIGEGSRMR